MPKYGGKPCPGDVTTKRSCSGGKCPPKPVDGGWTDWGKWSECGTGCTKERARRCSNPIPQNGGRKCSGNTKQVADCTGGKCRVDGGWGEWGTWSQCDADCTKHRGRSCSNPAPMNGGKACSGRAKETVTCTGGKCPVDGEWTDWGLWSECRTDCTRERSRSCTAPAPSNGGKDCVGTARQTSTCSGGKCVVHGRWSDWGVWSECAADCTKTRSRSCTAPQNGGKDCIGRATESLACSGGKCVVDGKWTDWGVWTECAADCTKTRSRSCTAPQNGGKDCIGRATESLACSGGKCVVDGKWTDWGVWTECAADCTKTRSRSCTAPQNGGKDCIGRATESLACSGGKCVVDGKWTDWGVWTECAVDCTKTRSRSCTAPQNGGKDCIGRATESLACSGGKCVVDGKWTDWGVWTECAADCTKTRSRSCTAPQNGGKDCIGRATESLACSGGKCVVDGKWTDWGVWTECAADCTKTRSRSCTAPQNGGKDCIGRATESLACSGGKCVVDGKWTDWGVWTECAADCTKTRSRSCTATQNGGKDCIGRATESLACSGGKCVVDGKWTDWGIWTECAADCTKTRSRSCTAPQNGGKACIGDSSESVACTGGQCVIDGEWTDWGVWTQCAADCTKSRSRACTNPAPANGGKGCGGQDTETQACSGGLCAAAGVKGTSAWAR